VSNEAISEEEDEKVEKKEKVENGLSDLVQGLKNDKLFGNAESKKRKFSDIQQSVIEPVKKFFKR
jgi:hypothetical protein